MKFEQACRFRIQTGYAICAKTEGIRPGDEKKLGEVFNDVMNPLMPKTGNWVYTCTAKGDDVFFTLSTMRTDSSGRRSIFHHSYLCPQKEYASQMRSDPAFLLSLPIDQMRTQNESAPLPPFEMDPTLKRPFHLQELREKYQLDNDRYALLLFLGYRAMTRGTSLCLRAEPGQDPLTLVREFAYCLAEGLVPMLRGNITYSTAADLRQRICVQFPGSAVVGSGSSPFPVRPSTQTARVSMDPLSQKFFQQLAAATEEDRAIILDRIDRWLSHVTTERYISASLIVTGYYLTCHQTIENKELLVLFRNLDNLLHNQASATPGLDETLCALMGHCLRAGVIPVAALGSLVEYVDYAQTSQYRELLWQLLAQAPVKEQLQLAADLATKSQSDRTDGVLFYLIQIISPEEIRRVPDLSVTLLHWLITRPTPPEGASTLAKGLLALLSTAELKQLVASLLDDGRAAGMTPLAEAVMGTALTQLIRSGNAAEACLDQPHCLLLDQYWKDEALQSILIQYFFLVRISQKGAVSSKISLLQEVQQRDAAWHGTLVEYLKKNPACEPGLLENYFEHLYLKRPWSHPELSAVCYRYNYFHNANGVFERTLQQKWTKESHTLFRNMAEAMVDPVKRKVPQVKPGWAIKRAVEWLLNEKYDILQLNVSEPTKQKLLSEDLRLFWGEIGFADIAWNAVFIPQSTFEGMPVEPNDRMALLQALQNCFPPRFDTQTICQLMHTPGLIPSEEMASVQEGIENLMLRLARKDQVLLVDLMLLACEGYDAKDKKLNQKFDLAQIFVDLEDFEKNQPFDFMGRLQISLQDSLLLQYSPGLLDKMRARAKRHKSSLLITQLVNGTSYQQSYGSAPGYEVGPEAQHPISSQTPGNAPLPSGEPVPPSTGRTLSMPASYTEPHTSPYTSPETGLLGPPPQRQEPPVPGHRAPPAPWADSEPVQPVSAPRPVNPEPVQQEPVQVRHKGGTYPSSLGDGWDNISLDSPAPRKKASDLHTPMPSTPQRIHHAKPEKKERPDGKTVYIAPETEKKKSKSSFGNFLDGLLGGRKK